MGIWNGFDEADVEIHREEIAAERAQHEREQAAELEAELSEECDRLSSEAKKRHRVSCGYWDFPEFAAVREALEREGVTNDYYWAWYKRFTTVWDPLHQAAMAAFDAVERAHQAWEKARKASAA